MAEPFSLTVLGASPAFPNAGGACSGYLVRYGSRTVLMDCGAGVAGRLRQWVEPWDLDAILISHLHADHYIDLAALYYGLRYTRRDGPPRRVPLHLPPSGQARLRQLGRIIGGRDSMFESVYAISEYASGGSLRLDGLEISFHPVQHFVPSHAMRLRAADGRLLAYSADAGPCSALVAAARDADLFLCEAAWLSADEDEPQPRRRGHLTAAEAGATARAAGARHLLLTHYRWGNDALVSGQRDAAQAAFGGAVEMAAEGQVYPIG